MYNISCGDIIILINMSKMEDYDLGLVVNWNCKNYDNAVEYGMLILEEINNDREKVRFLLQQNKRIISNLSYVERYLNHKNITIGILWHYPIPINNETGKVFCDIAEELARKKYRVYVFGQIDPSSFYSIPLMNPRYIPIEREYGYSFECTNRFSITCAEDFVEKNVIKLNRLIVMHDMDDEYIKLSNEISEKFDRYNQYIDILLTERKNDKSSFPTTENYIVELSILNRELNDGT